MEDGSPGCLEAFTAKGSHGLQSLQPSYKPPYVTTWVPVIPKIYNSGKKGVGGGGRE